MGVLPNRDTRKPSSRDYGYLAIHDPVRIIVHHPAFQGFGELMLPWDDNSRYYDTSLNRVGSLMPYHSHVDPDIVVGALNRIEQVEFHLKKAIENGLTKEELAAAITHIAFYAGWPTAASAFSHLKKVLDQK